MDVWRLMLAHASVAGDGPTFIAHSGTVFQSRCEPAMQIGTIVAFRDDSDRPHADMALRNGDRVRVVLDGGGMTITQIAGSADPEILFQAGPKIVAYICAGLVASPRRLEATPLRILTAAIVQLGSASEVRAAFESAAAQVL
jgi:hypothetical protein